MDRGGEGEREGARDVVREGGRERGGKREKVLSDGGDSVRVITKGRLCQMSGQGDDREFGFDKQSPKGNIIDSLKRRPYQTKWKGKVEEAGGGRGTHIGGRRGQSREEREEEEERKERGEPAGT